MHTATGSAAAAAEGAADSPAGRDRILFSLGHREFHISDALVASRLTGEYDEVVAAARHGSEREGTAGVGGPSEAEVDAARVEFRRRRRLLSGDDLLSWLRSWHVSLPEWTTWVRRSLLAAAPSKDEPPSTADAAPPNPQDVWVHAVCSGAIERWAKLLAGWAACDDELQDRDGRRRDTPPRAVPLPPSGLERLCAPDTDHGERALRVAVLRDAADAFAAKHAAPAAVDHELDTNAALWMLVECRYLELASAGAGREARLCLRIDGDSIDDVARRASATVADRTFLLRDTPPVLAAHLLSTPPGNVVGAIELDDAYVVAEIERRRLGTDDADVRSLAAAELVETAIRAAVAERITWADGLAHLAERGPRDDGIRRTA